MTINWYSFPNFEEREFACRETGECNMQEEALEYFQDLRTSCKRPLTVSSGYRIISHPIEIDKIDRYGRSGAHNVGFPADFAGAAQDAIGFLRFAPNDPRGMGTGIQQKGPWYSLLSKLQRENRSTSGAACDPGVTRNKKRLSTMSAKSLFLLVGPTGFEPVTP